MADLYKTSTIRITTTPAELRKLADALESAWKSATLGDSLTVETWVGEDCRVEFCLNQEKMGK